MWQKKFKHSQQNDEFLQCKIIVVVIMFINGLENKDGKIITNYIRLAVRSMRKKASKKTYKIVTA